MFQVRPTTRPSDGARGKMMGSFKPTTWTNLVSQHNFKIHLNTFVEEVFPYCNKGPLDPLLYLQTQKCIRPTTPVRKNSSRKPFKRERMWKKPQEELQKKDPSPRTDGPAIHVTYTDHMFNQTLVTGRSVTPSVLGEVASCKSDNRYPQSSEGGGSHFSLF